MPYFRITIHYEDGSSLRCIRLHNAYDIEFANRYFAERLKLHGRGKVVKELEVVMVSKQSKEVRDYISSQAKRGFQ